MTPNKFRKIRQFRPGEFMKLGQSSFRRILLSRLLLLSVPVLLMGVYVTYRKARSAFLETARQNLTESAVRKGESIKQSIEALQANLITASDNVVLKLGSRSEKQAFVEQLATKLPMEIYCIQLTDLETEQITANTCDSHFDINLNTSSWPQEKKQLLTNPQNIHIATLLPNEKVNLEPSQNQSQLQLLLAAPVYNLRGKLRYSLSIQADLLRKEKVEPGSLEGYPVIINEQGIILAHPLPKRVGSNIEQEADAARLQSLMNKALRGEQNFLHLFALEKNGVELLAGYSAIPSPVTRKEGQKWIVLAVTPLDNALALLAEIKQVLFYLVLALIVVTVLATLYISRKLAKPLEQLTSYALNNGHWLNNQPIPSNFGIREFNQLSSALEEMIDRLKTWADEIAFAWKEAHQANQIKSEFLATTSHELRTPLNGIINSIRIVKDDYCDTPEEAQEFLQQADDAAIHLLGIINDILDLSKIEAGKLSVVIEPVNLNKLLKEVADLQAAVIKKKGLKFITPQWQEEIKVNADPAKLKQVLLNVVGNAIKFTEAGSITIKYWIKKELITPKSQLEISGLDSSAELILSSSLLEANTSTSKPQKVVITITDTGIGIDPKQQEKLFRPFVMIDGSTTRKFRGTGLGLAISRNLIELMKGSITLYSPGLDRGTTVEISLPLQGTKLVGEVEKQNNREPIRSAFS